jgi:hypothetical protein
MRRWERATRHVLCGGCGAAIETGDPVLVYFGATAGATPRRFIRCASCGGGAPPDLPTAIVFDPTPLPRLDMTRLGVLPLDFRTRAAGEREPGEEG